MVGVSCVVQGFRASAIPRPTIGSDFNQERANARSKRRSSHVEGRVANIEIVRDLFDEVVCRMTARRANV